MKLLKAKKGKYLQTRMITVTVETEKGPRTIRLNDVVQIQRVTWLRRFGDWASLDLRSGETVFFYSPKYEDIVRAIQAIITLEHRNKLRSERVKRKEHFRKISNPEVTRNT